MSDYHFTTRWQLDATCKEVYRTLEEADALSRWWPSVYLDVKMLEKGRPGGVGKRVALYTKGWLPYTLKWEFIVTEAEFPKGYTLKALGDFEGTGVWTFSRLENGQCEAVYDWQISAEKPLLKKLTWLMRPVFSANHHWAMKKGEESLKLELQRRALNGRPGPPVPDPPPPVFPHNLTNNKVFK